MPPKPKTPEQLLQDKEHIIDEAVRLIAKSGLEQFSIRKLSTGPKYLDYIGTPLEGPAGMEKQNSLSNLHYLEELLREFVPGQDDDFYHVTAVRITCEIHGIISLTHSRMLDEMSTSTETVTGSLLPFLLSGLSP